MIKFWIALVLVNLFLVFGVFAEVPVPELRSRIIDLASSLAPAEKSQIESILTAFEKRKGSQITVLLLSTTQPETIEQYSLRVAEKWKIGRTKVDDGVILVVAKDDRALRIEVGYGLEGALSDIVSKRIIDEIIVPQFRAGNIFGGILYGVNAIIGVVDGEPLPLPPKGSSAGVASAAIDWIFPVLMLVLVITQITRPALGAIGAGALCSALALVASFFLLSALAALGVGIIVFVVSVLFGALPRQGRYGSGRGGYYSGRSSGGGFSGGGFRGGGGSFGGGGASGRW